MPAKPAPPPSLERQARARRLGDYFALQLAFAERLSAASGTPLGEVVLWRTNLHRRLGLGPPDPKSQSLTWTAYVAGLEQRATLEDRTAWTQAAYAAAPEEVLAPDQTAFGCFSCVPPDPTGEVRFHFSGGDPHALVGPLARESLPDRITELTRMFAFIPAAWPEAQRVRGRSWLYNIEAYRRLFPPAYGNSRRRQVGRVNLNGTSNWGQFLDHREQIRPAARDALLANLETLDIAAPWRAFPLQALETEAPIGLFHDFYRTMR